MTQNPKTHEDFMRLALKEADQAFLENEVPVGCIIQKNNEVIASTYNQSYKMRCSTRHAECIAIEQAQKVLGDFRLTDCVLYVTIEPCAMCAGAIYLARIKTLVFGAYDFRGGACGTTINVLQNNFINHRTNVISGILESLCKERMSLFFQKRRKENKNKNSSETLLGEVSEW